MREFKRKHDKDDLRPREDDRSQRLEDLENEVNGQKLLVVVC